MFHGASRNNFRRLPLCLLLGLGLGNTHVMATTPDPVSVAAGTDWYGDDGSWSTVYIGIGNDDNTNIFSVLPNTVGVDVLLVDAAGGCDNVSLPDCASKRGWLFSANASTAWTEDGGYQEASYNGIGLSSIDALYGSDYVTVEINTQSSAFSGINATTSVATFNSSDAWVGFLGLAPYRSDLSDLDQSTFMSNLWSDGSSVPSCSYGYTAGAYYRLKGVPASLTIGGVDELRYVSNNNTFNLSPQGLPVVSLNSVEVNSGLNDGIDSPSLFVESFGDSYFTLDSSTPYIWLPASTCDAISQALNLTYDESLDLYTYGNGANGTSIHDDLSSSNISFTFSLADFSGSSDVVNITLPFSAFDHSLSYPFPNLDINDTSQTVPYFPIKPASDNDQYRLGRVFFQEAYLVVDYTRSNFSIYQASFEASIMNETNLIAIEPAPDSMDSYQEESLSRGQTAGIVVGCVTGLGLIIFLLWWFFFRKRYALNPCIRRRDRDESDLGKPEMKGPSESTVSRIPRRWRNWVYRGRAEIEGDQVQPSELPATAVYELAGSTPGDGQRPSSTTPSKQALRRRSAVPSVAQSSIVSLSSTSPRTSVTSNESVEEELISPPPPPDRPSSVAKYTFNPTGETVIS